MVRTRAEKMERRKRGLRMSTSVNLISMMDILTVLLLFLLKSYVAEGEVMVPAPGVTLPTSTAEQAVQPTPVVAIAGDAILLDGQQVASVSEALNDPRGEIPSLAEKLQALRHKQDEDAAQIGIKTGASHLVTIQGDRNVEYRVLRKVMITLSQSGYESVSLAVLRNT